MAIFTNCRLHKLGKVFPAIRVYKTLLNPTPQVAMHHEIQFLKILIRLYEGYSLSLMRLKNFEGIPLGEIRIGNSHHHGGR